MKTLSSQNGKLLKFRHGAFALGLAGLAFIICLLQGQRTFNFVDTTYLLENVNRIQGGEVPYRDFFLVLPPVHYYLNWIGFHFSGGQVFSIVITGSLVNAAIVVVAFSILLRLQIPPLLSATFSACAAVTGAFELGCSGYDSESVLWCLVSMRLWMRGDRESGAGRQLAAGLLAGVAILTKINIGVPFALAIIGTHCVLMLKGDRSIWRAVGWFTLGLLLSLGSICLTLAMCGALQPAIEQTLIFPAKMRLSLVMNLLRSLPIPRLSSFSSLSYVSWYPVLVIVWCLAIYAGVRLLRGAPSPVERLILPLLAILLGGMQSQSINSLYGLGGVAALSLGACFLMLRDHQTIERRAIAGVAVFFIGAHLLSGLQLERLGFLRETTGQSKSFVLRQFAGMRGYGPSVDSIESAVIWTKENISPTEKIFLWPGMSPYYLASGRACPLPNFQVFGETGLNPAAALQELNQSRIEWVLVDFSSSIVIDLGGFRSVQAEFIRQYKFEKRLDGWLLFKRKSAVI